MKEIRFDASIAGIQEWRNLYRNIQTSCGTLLDTIGGIPRQIGEVFLHVCSEGRGFYQFESFLKASGLPEVYREIRRNLEKYVAQTSPIGRGLPEASEHFLIIEPVRLGEDIRAEPNSETARFLAEQRTIEEILSAFGNRQN